MSALRESRFRGTAQLNVPDGAAGDAESPKHFLPRPEPAQSPTEAATSTSPPAAAAASASAGVEPHAAPAADPDGARRALGSVDLTHLTGEKRARYGLLMARLLEATAYDQAAINELHVVTEAAPSSVEAWLALDLGLMKCRLMGGSSPALAGMFLSRFSAITTPPA